MIAFSLKKRCILLKILSTKQNGLIMPTKNHFEWLFRAKKKRYEDLIWVWMW